MRVALLYMVPGPKRHGGAAYTVHLMRAMRQQGLEPVLFQLASRSNNKPRRFVAELTYQHIDTASAVAMCKAMPVLVLYSHFKHFRNDTLLLLQARASIVFHATAELHSDLVAEVERLGTRCIAIRESLAGHLQAEGVNATFIRHPYIRNEAAKPFPRRMHAVSLSRVDYAKHTELVAEANSMLALDRKVAIYGDVNRMFAFHTLDKAFPAWRENYSGPFKLGMGLRLAKAATFVVDLTYWKNDGGGTQYTFLEAWDAGAHLVVHKRWCELPGPVEDGRTAVAVEDAQTLVDALQVPNEQCRLAGFRELEHHAPERVVPRYAEALGWE